MARTPPSIQLGSNDWKMTAITQEEIMSTKKALSVNFAQSIATTSFLPRPPVIASYRSGWQNINFAHYQLPAWEIPEMASPQHTIAFSSPQSTPATELVFANRVYQVARVEKQQSIGIFPSKLLMKCRWSEESEFSHVYLDSTFLNHAAHESVNPDRVEIMLQIPPLADPLIWQIGASLKSVLEHNPHNSCFYAESMATALAAHLLQFYTTRPQALQEYGDGLSKIKINQAIEYINEHLHLNLTLTEIATELEMSQYYFCRLFKQSIGMTPHQYLIQQRVERSRQLLKQLESKIVDIATECGFANPSHFAKCFRQRVGISPQQFRSIWRQ
jgi:AraC family transcriptional regulator